MTLNEEEQAAMDHIIAAMNIICHDWDLAANQGELASAVHKLQHFVIQHALYRVDPEQWNSWYA